ncbi:MAG: hypothetical protein Q8O75_01110 [bacterium]|nr:hypothetical protein [bacterium]
MKKDRKERLIAQIKPYRALSVEQQKMEKEIILKLFKEFWQLNPTEQEFYDFVASLVLFPEIIYHMVKK